MPFDELSVDTVLIGAGQAGLATSYHLARQGVEHLLLDESEEVGDSWRKRWDTLRLFTPGRYDGLPGMPFPGPQGSYPSKDELADYLKAYASRFDLPVRSGVRVDRLSRDDRRFVLQVGDDTMDARNVVVATGSYHHPNIPGFSADIDESVVQLHSSQYRRPSQLRDGPVLVVGAGNSGAEISLDVTPGRKTWLSGPEVGREPTSAGTLPDRVFTPIMWFMATRLLSVGNPIGRGARDHFLRPPRGIPWGRVKQKDIAAAGIDRVARTVGASGGYPILEDGNVLKASNIIWCTGFAPGFEWIDLPILDEYGWPIQDRGVVGSVPGLYFMGLLFQHTLSSALVGGVGRDARWVADHISRRNSDELAERVKTSG